MPCRDYGADESHSSSTAGEIVLLKMRCDLLARIACKVMYGLEEKKAVEDVLQDPEVSIWYKEHKKLDQKRLAQEEKLKAKQKLDEELRKQALAKLTPEERTAFGFNKRKKV